MEGRFNGGFFCVTSLGGLYLEGLIHGGAYFRNFTVAQVSDSMLLWVLFRLSLSTMFRLQNGSQSGLMRSHLNDENIQVLILCYI